MSSVGCTRLTLTCKADGRGKAKPVCIDRPAKQDCTYSLIHSFIHSFLHSFIHSFIQAMMMMMMNITGLCCVIEVMHCDGGAVYCVNCGRGGGHMMVAMMIVIMVFRYVDLFDNAMLEQNIYKENNNPINI